MEEESVGTYKDMLISKWRELYKLGRMVRESYILGETDIQGFAVYKASLIRMWFELYPHVKGRKDIRADTIEKFMKYQKGCQEPSELKEVDLSDLENVLGDILVQLRVLSL